MILDKKIEIKITKRNINHYSKFFNVNLKDLILIDVEEHLQKGSNIKLNVKCDICKCSRYITYQSYIKNINSCDEHPIYTCDKCSHIKIKSNNLKKYGVEYFSKTKEYTRKFKKTMIEKYGVEYAQQSETIREKTKKTNLENFGVENPFFDNEMIRNKFNEKWGVDHPSKVKSINKRIKKTKELNGNSLSSPEIRDKIKKTNNIKSLRDNTISNDKQYIKYIGEFTSMFNCEKGHIFYIDSSNYHDRKRSNLPICTVCNPIGDSQSIKEKELFIFIKSLYKSEIIQSYRDGLEIDIYLPELKIGFEFNGLYWHSEEHKDKNYHINKTKHFKERGIRIIHIWEDDWDFKNEIIKSQIRNWICLTENRIFARKCVVKTVPTKECIKFLNENHIQGKVNSSLKIGLYHNDLLVSLMTFDHFEGRNKMDDDNWNLNRFCNLLNTNVIGSASKLFKFFLKNYNVNRVISYADMDWSVGDLYHKLGFNLISESRVDYKYILENKRVNKSRFRKSRLNTNLSESEQMKKSHINRIWDCGKMKFEILV